MGTDYNKCYSDLQDELDNARITLTALNDNIRRIIGRNPKELRNDKFNQTNSASKHEFNRSRRSPTNQRKSNDSFNSSTTSHQNTNISGKSVFTRLSAPNHRSQEPRRLSSRVVRELPSRQEILAAQNTDSESRARNRRMFGSLMGTLQKFCQEESRLKQKEDKKAQIEKKLEEQEIQEREFLKKERETLFLDRKRKQLEIKKIELKMNRLKDFKVWENVHKNLRFHIKTKTKPHLYYRPRIMSEKTEELLKQCQISMDLIGKERAATLDKEFQDIENNSKVNEYDLDESMDTSDKNGIEKPYDSKRENDTPSPNLCTIRGDVDSKENDDNEPMLNSSVIVVNN